MSQGVIGDDAFAAFNDLDRGDWVGVDRHGHGHPQGRAVGQGDRRFELLAKALRPLPDKWKGLSDVDQRYRQRYVDLVVNDEARPRARHPRPGPCAALRERLDDQGYLEVETPDPQPGAGRGHRPARSSPTTTPSTSTPTCASRSSCPLKRLIVGGIERVFEIGRIFRNEGIDTRHNPEFTMLEAYAAFGDYTDMMAPHRGPGGRGGARPPSAAPR